MQEITALKGFLVAIKARYESLYHSDPKKASKLYSAYSAISSATELLSKGKLNEPGQRLLAEIAYYIVAVIREGRYLPPVGEDPLLIIIDDLLEPEALQLISRLKYEVSCSQAAPGYGGMMEVVLLQLGELRKEIARLREKKPRKTARKAKGEVPPEFPLEFYG